MLASGSTDRKLQLWKLLPASEAAGRPAQTSARDGGEGAFGWVKTACMTGHSGTIVALAFAPAVAPDARGELPRVRLVSGSYDRSARCPNVLCACPHVLCASLLVCAEGGVVGCRAGGEMVSHTQTYTHAHTHTHTHTHDVHGRLWEMGPGERGAKEVLRLSGHNHWVMSVCYRLVSCTCNSSSTSGT